jgi:hypothetical protein
MLVETATKLGEEYLWHRELKFGVSEEDWLLQFGWTESFIGTLRYKGKRRGKGTYVYDLSVDHVSRGKKDSSILVLNDKVRADRVLMERALRYDYKIGAQAEEDRLEVERQAAESGDEIQGDAP